MINILNKLKERLNLASTPKTQLVYRYVSQKELSFFENGETENLGNYFYGKGLANNHKYRPGEKYIHFFKDQNIPTHVLSSLTKGEKYLCKFEIESDLLKKYEGTGTYEPSGYDDYTYIKEYALPASKYESEMFIGAEIYNPSLGQQSNNTSTDKSNNVLLNTTCYQDKTIFASTNENFNTQQEFEDNIQQEQ